MAASTDPSPDSAPSNGTAPAETSRPVDAFALLTQPRRPWLDPESLKATFLEFSRAQHPDRLPGTASAEDKQRASHRYALLNEAYRILREPRERLLHLLELERGKPPQDIQRIPPGTMDLFIEVGQVCRDCDTFIHSRTGESKEGSPMLALRQMQANLEWTRKLQDLLQRIQALQAAQDQELREMNTAWEISPPSSQPAGQTSDLPLDRLEEIYRLSSYISRWTEQIQERLVSLAT